MSIQRALLKIIVPSYSHRTPLGFYFRKGCIRYWVTCDYLGEHVIPGNVLMRQRGTVFHPGLNVSFWPLPGDPIAVLEWWTTYTHKIIVSYSECSSEYGKIIIFFSALICWAICCIEGAIVFLDLLQVGMGRDHTLFALVTGHVQFTRVARKLVAPQKGQKWVKKPWRKFINVIKSEPTLTQTVVLKQLR